MRLADLTSGIPLTGDLSLSSDLEITGLTEDSRAVAPGMLFAGLPGTRADGMAFARDAISRGAAAILAEASADLPEGYPVPVLIATQSRRAFALMAARFHGPQPDIAAAITGTNGKTSVAAFLRQFWIATGKRAASLGTVGIVTETSETPLSHTTPDPVALHKHLARLAGAGITHLAIEASSHGLAQHRLDGVRLAAGAFTNVTRDHLDYHSSLEDYLSAKLRLFSELLGPGKPAVIAASGPGAEAFIQAARSRRLSVLTVGEGGDAIQLLAVERQGFAQRLTFRHHGRLRTAELPLAGAFQVSNALVAAGLAIALGSDPDEVFPAIETLKGAKGRLEYVGAAPSGAPIFIDYAHTPDALAKALQALRPYVSGKLRVVFGCGGDRDRGKRPEMGAAAAAHADAVIVTDDNPRSEDPGSIRRAILASAPGASEIGNRAEAIATAIADLKCGDVLLVAGKGHETGQIVAGAVIPYSDHDAVAAALARQNSARRSEA